MQGIKKETYQLMNKKVTPNNYPNADLSAGDFEVTGTSADVSRPEIDTNTLTVTLPDSQDAVTVGDTVKVSVKITDEGSGVAYVYFTYTAPQTSRTSDFRAECIDEEGTYEAKITVNDDMPSGVWQIRSIYAGDKKGNR